MRRWPPGLERLTARLLLLALLGAGCEQVGTVGIGFDSNTSQIAWVDLPFAPPSDIDVLFVVDDSASMQPAQAALARSLATLIGALNPAASAAKPRHFHLGVVTSDLGAGMSSSGECALFGDAGLLVPLGRAAPTDCVAPNGRFLDVDQAGGDNLPAGRTLVQTLGCMLAVGATGCGFAQPLEAAYRALTDTNTNAGFVRDDALLVVVFISGQDDCSAPVDSALFDAARGDLGRFDSFRCVSAGVSCGNPPQPPSVGDPRSDCSAASGGLLYDLSRYRELFFGATGLKRDPNQVQLVMSAAPPAPVWVQNDAEGDPQLQPSCSAGSLSGLPAVRLLALAANSPRSLTASICSAGADDYLFDTLATDLDSADGTEACLPAPIANPDDPDCMVSDGGLAIASCADSSGVTPCWELATRGNCVPIYNPHTRDDEQLALTIRRASITPPVTALTARCRVIDARN
jgi:hypothetical protein